FSCGGRSANGVSSAGEPDRARRLQRAARNPGVAVVAARVGGGGDPRADGGDDVPPRAAAERHARPGAGTGRSTMSIAIPEVSARRQAAAYLELTKPRIVMLVVMTGVPALLLAA